MPIPCDFCGKPIEEKDELFEISTMSAFSIHYYFHLDCWKMWRNMWHDKWGALGITFESLNKFYEYSEDVPDVIKNLPVELFPEGNQDKPRENEDK